MRLSLGARWILAPFLILNLSFITGCVSYQQSRALLSAPPSDLPTRHVLNNVPFVAQEDYFCGPSAMSMMLQTQGINPSLETLIGMVYVPARNGSFQVELKAAARRFDMVPYELRPKVEDVLREVSNGNPVLVLQNLGLESYPTWHYAVVIGYDLAEKEVFLHSGLDASTSIAITTFERTWADFSSGWALVMLPPTQLPASAEPFPYQKSLEGLVQTTRTKPALAGYQTALKQWPDNSSLGIGYGNLLYQQEQFSRAGTVFLKALKHNALDANLWNNLSYALAQQGCQNSVEASACAVRIQPDNQVFSSTLNDIKSILATKPREENTCPTLPSCAVSD